MLTEIRAFIEEHKLLQSDNRPVVIGLSGGADSVALTCVLHSLGYRCVAAHCNFNLRAEESLRDRDFAEQIALTLGIDFTETAFNTAQYASEKHLSIEMAARELRYDWFERQRLRFNAQAIAVAHHQDDNAETVIMALLRGSGIRGMRGMLPRQGYIVRPLLSVSRADILKWLKERNLNYVDDSSNFSDEYLRNFIRLRIMPMLENINPSVSGSIARSAGYLRETEEIYEYAINAARENIADDNGNLNIETLLHYPAPATILYELLRPYNFSRHIVADIFRSINGESGRQFFSPTHRIVKDRDSLLLSQITSSTPQTTYFPIEKETRVAMAGELIIESCTQDNDDNFKIDYDVSIGSFDFDKLKFPLILRCPKEGDRFVPFGMKGRKKLSDFFIDNKYSLPDKEQALVVCSGEDIIWVVGKRIDERYKISKSTKKVFVLKISSAY
jgi:tRNA(Ile)-lysidine synthase